MGGFSSSEGPRPQCPLEERKLGGAVLPRQLSSYGGHVVPNMATRWSTNPTNGYTWVHPGIPETKWESLETGSFGGPPKSPPSVQEAFFEHPPRPRPPWEKGMSADHSGPPVSPSACPPLGPGDPQRVRATPQDFLGPLRALYWDLIFA